MTLGSIEVRRAVGAVAITLALVSHVATAQSTKQSPPSGSKKGDAKARVLSPEQQEVRRHFEIGYDKYRSGDLAVARMWFEAGLAKDPDNWLGHFFLAETLAGMRLPEAEQHYAQATKLAPATTRAKAAKSQKTRPVRDNGPPPLTLDQEQARQLFSAAFEHFQNGDFAVARMGFEEGLAKDPANAVARYYLAEALVRMRLFGEAQQQLEQAIALAPQSTVARRAEVALVEVQTFVANAGTKCEVEMPMKSATRRIDWSGPCLNGKADGVGILRLYDGAVLTLISRQRRTSGGNPEFITTFGKAPDGAIIITDFSRSRKVEPKAVSPAEVPEWAREIVDGKPRTQ